MSALALRPSQAHACSCAEPFANELRVGDGLIPSNAAGVPWWLPTNFSSDAPESLVQLERWENEELRPVALVLEPYEGLYLIRPAAGWSQGERYRISIDAGASSRVLAEERFRTAEIEIVAPIESGVLTLSINEQQRSPLRLLDIHGACADRFDADFVDVGASSNLEEFPRGSLFYETYVDGQRWQPRTSLCATIEPGSSWIARGRDRIVADCSGRAEPQVSVGPGQHRVQIKARLAGTNVVFTSNEQLVELCREASPATSASDPQLEGRPASTLRPPLDTTGLAPSQEGSVAGDEEDTPLVVASSDRGCALSSTASGRWLGGAVALLACAMTATRRRSASRRRESPSA